MNAITTLAPITFDTYTFNTTIDLHIQETDGTRDYVAAVATLTPQLAIELIAELALALESIPEHAKLGGALNAHIDAQSAR